MKIPHLLALASALVLMFPVVLADIEATTEPDWSGPTSADVDETITLRLTSRALISVDAEDTTYFLSTERLEGTATKSGGECMAAASGIHLIGGEKFLENADGFACQWRIGPHNMPPGEHVFDFGLWFDLTIHDGGQEEWGSGYSSADGAALGPTHTVSVYECTGGLLECRVDFDAEG